MKMNATRALALAVVVLCASVASAQTIDDIQFYDPVTGAPASPYAGTSVTVEGVIYVVKGTYNSGTHYFQGATGGINFFDTGAIPLTYGDRIQVTGTVGAYSGEINVNPSNIVFMGNEAEPTPTQWTVSQIMSDYETVGNFAYCVGTVTQVNASNFYITDGDSTMQVYIDSTTGIDISAVAIGDEYGVTSPVVVYNGEIEMKPRVQGDLVEDPTGDTLPVIENVNLASWVPEASDPITVTADITDDSGISSATLYFRDDDGDSTGVFSSAAMTHMGGGVYSGTIPAMHTEREVHFYVEAIDDALQGATSPGAAPVAWYEVAIGFTSLYDCNYVHPDSFPQSSPLRDEVANIQGLVTAGTGDFGTSTSRFLVQDDDTGWNGILVYEGSGANYLLRGDEVQVGGYIDEYNTLTEMLPHNGSAVYLMSFDNELWAPALLTPDELADNSTLDGDSYTGEKWESMWVQTTISTVIDTTGVAQYGNFDITNAMPQDTLQVDPYVQLTYAAAPGDRVSVTGFLTQYYSFELVPLDDTGVYVDMSNAVDDGPIKPAGGFSSIAPNPFNPKAEIRFVMTRDNMAQLNIYNLRGEHVKTLVNGRLTGGQEHMYSWDGTDNTGRRMASGTYFARLRIGAEVMQVRKLMLVK